MSLFFESIRVINGRVMNLNEHQIRVNRCLGEPSLNLRIFIKKLSIPKLGVYKLRIQYNSEIQKITNHSIQEYTEKEIHTLKMVETHSLVYSHKSEDRESLNYLFSKREECDDILIINDGMISDSWYCNVAFYNGKEWSTPKDCLLPGTMRAKLIKKGIIQEKEIQVKDLSEYTKIRLFNAMIPWSRRKEVMVI